ncbi:MAG: aminotransferase class V-fold PLP-dependent enzyme, partial [Cyanobacteria bacterium P01_C01_bin.118]
MPESPIYLDCNATTPVDPRVVDAMMPFFIDYFGNPSSLHSYGWQAEAAVEKSRETIATTINAQPE